MNVSEALKSCYLPRLEAEVLLSHVLHKSRTWITAHPEYHLSENEQTSYHHCCQRRKKGEPTAYVTGTRDFFKRPFMVNSSVLIPRPSTELLIEMAVDFIEKGTEDIREVDTQIIVLSKRTIADFPEIQTVVDIGTGSGCIAVTLACELPNYHYIATDVSNEALVVASENAKKHDVTDKIKFLHGNLFDPLQHLDEPFIAVTNPPYIPDTEELMKDVTDYEPHLALFGGKDGADFVRSIWKSALAHPYCAGLVMECRSEHAPLLNNTPPDTIGA